MADLNFQINVGGNAPEAIGSLKKQLREAQQEVVALSDKFGATSKEAAEAAKRAADLKDRIGDAKALVAAFNPDQKFTALSKSLGAVAGGFSAIQGAMGLFGAEGKELEKTMLKVQSALALSQGLEQLGDLGDAFKNLKSVAVSVFNSIKTAIGSTGIGLLVVALGAIYAYWDDIKAVVSGVSDEQEKLNKATKENLKAQQDKLNAIGEQDNILKLQGKSEKEILNIKIKQSDEAIKAAEINLANAKATRDAQVAAAKRNKEILQGLIAFVSLPITAVLKGIDAIGSAMGKNYNLYEKYSGGLASMVFDPEETAKEGDAAIKEAEKTLTSLKNGRAGYQLAVQGIDKAARDKATQTAEQNAEKQKALEEQLLKDKIAREDAAFKVSKDSYVASLSDRNKALYQIEDKYEEQRSTLIRAGIYDFTAIEEEKRIALEKVNKDFDEKEKADQDKKNADKLQKEQDYIDKVLELQGLTAKTEEEKRAAQIAVLEEDYNRKIALAQKEGQDVTILEEIKAAKIKKIKDDAAESDKKLKKAAFDNEVATAGETLNILSGLVDKNSIAGKAIAVSQAIINTYQGASKALAQTGVLGPVAAAATIAAGLLNVKKIIATKVPSAKGGGDVGGGSAPSISAAAPISPQIPQTATTNISAQSINALGNQAIKAYVVETDVTTNQQRIKAIQQRARFD